jgi:UDP-N-acetylglucosamine acyltransferase
MGVDKTAVVDRSAEIGDVDIGPYAVVGAGVRLHDGVVLGPHAVVVGATEVGPRTKIDAHVVLGGAPQDLKHDADAPTQLVIGSDNVFREFSTAHRGSSLGRKVTTIGDRNYFMCNSHVAHDCIVGNDCAFANSVAIAGHVDIGDGVVLGGLAGVHQRARIGRLAMVGAGAMCTQDVPPFTLVQGDRARLFGLNIVGLKRAGLDVTAVSALKTAWRTLFVSGLAMRTAMGKVKDEHGDVPEVLELLAFLETTQRGICRAAAQAEKAA